MVESLLIPSGQFKGLVPGLDGRQINQPFVIEGANFLVGAKGIYSAFGTNFVTYEKIYDPQSVQTFRVGSQIFTFTRGSVIGFDHTAQVYYPIFTFTDPGIIWPWSMAVVGGLYYFAKKGVGLLQYNPNTYTWTTITANVPSGLVGVCQSVGRLVLLGTSIVAWSAIDNGTDLITDSTKGVGSQALAMIGSGEPFAVLETNDGFVVYTKKGLLKAEFTSTLNPYRFYPLTEATDGHDLPFSPFSIKSIGNRVHVYLTRAGFRITNGRQPEPWQPLMSEHFHNDILPLYDLGNIASFRFSYNPDLNWFIVSLAEATNQLLYKSAFVLYLPRDEWGSFDRAHTGFGELDIAAGLDNAYNFGYVCNHGCAQNFISGKYIEQNPISGLTYFYHTDYEIPARVQDGVTIFASVVQMEHIDSSQFNDGSGVYQLDFSEFYASPSVANYTEPAVIDATDGASVDIFACQMSFQNRMVLPSYQKQIGAFASLSSYIKVGLFRITDAKFPDTLSQLQKLAVGTDELAEPAIEVDLLTADQDDIDLLNDDLADRDFQINATQTDYLLRVYGTLDGVSTWDEQDKFPTIYQESGGTRLYETSNEGLFHIIELSALEEGQSFHLKSLEASGILVGRLG